MLLVVYMFAGCEKLEAASNVVDDFGDTTVAQGIFLGADIPEAIELPADSGIYTSYCKVFLAEVSNASDLGDAPVSGASVSFLAGSTGKLDFAETADGEYRLYSTDGLSYDPGEDARVQFTVGGEEGSLLVRAPEAPDFTTSDSPIAQAPMQVTITAGEFANVVAVVYDVDHSVQTWDNLPEDVEAAHDLNATDGEPITELEIPGEAFKRASTYVVGVGGLEVGDPAEFEGTNRALSTFAAGRLALRLVSVGPAAKP